MITLGFFIMSGGFNTPQLAAESSQNATSMMLDSVCRGIKSRQQSNSLHKRHTPELAPGGVITALVVVLIPGTGVIYTVNTGITRNAKYSVAAAVGCTLGIVPHMTACILGLSAIMNMSAKNQRL